MSNIKVYIDYQDYSGIANVYIVDESLDGQKRIVKSVNLEFVSLESGVAVEPTFQLSPVFVKPFLQAFADICDKHGIRPEGKPVLENELTSVKYHLEDMRKLIFEKRVK